VESQEKSLLLSDRWYTYLLVCGDGSYYAGITNDLERRVRQHNGEIAGGARYTRPRRPVQLVWSQQAESRSHAQRVEAALKQLSRAQKIELTVANRTLIFTDSGWEMVER